MTYGTPRQMKQQDLKPGFNDFTVDGVSAGKVWIEIIDTSNNNAVVSSGMGRKQVSRPDARFASTH